MAKSSTAVKEDLPREQGRPKQNGGGIRFTVDAAGKPDGVVMDTPEYIGLLVKANVTDPRRWPPRMKHGAKALARIRKIEAGCRKKHGKWDWELIPEADQDEYDGLCIELDKMLYPGEPIPLDELLAEHPQFQVK